METDTQAYSQAYRCAYDAFRNKDWEAFEKLCELQRGMFESPFPEYTYMGNKTMPPKEAVYLLSCEYEIV